MDRLGASDMFGAPTAQEEGPAPSAEPAGLPVIKQPGISTGIPSPADSAAGLSYTILDLLFEAVRRTASDLHLTAGAPPHLRIDGELEAQGLPILSPADIKGLVYSMMSEKQIKTFELEHEFDFAYSVKSLGRFRVNVFQQRGSIGCVIRSVPTMKLSIEELGLPGLTKDLVMRPRGIIFCTGPTGSARGIGSAACSARCLPPRPGDYCD